MDTYDFFEFSNTVTRAGYIMGQDDGLLLVHVRAAGVIRRLAVPPVADIPHELS